MIQRASPKIILSLVATFIGLILINSLLMQHSNSRNPRLLSSRSNISPISALTALISSSNPSSTGYDIAYQDDIDFDHKVASISHAVVPVPVPTFIKFRTAEEEKYYHRLATNPALVQGIRAFLDAESDGSFKVEDIMTLRNSPFRLLSLFQELSNDDLKGPYTTKVKLGLAEDEFYCDATDLLNVYDSDNWQGKNHFASEFDNAFLVEFLSSVYEYPNARIQSPDFLAKVKATSYNLPDSEREHLSEKIQFFFMKRQDFVFYFELGLRHTCLTQTVGYVPNLNNICQKATFPVMLKEYDEQYTDRRECFNGEDLFPTTFVLNNYGDCKDFFKHIKSKKYLKEKEVNPFQFLFKKGIGLHKGLGVSLLTQELEDKLIKDYNDGKKCGSLKEENVVQKYIPNPHLIKGTNKYDFRVYGLVASTNPLIAFFRDGLIRVSLREYVRDSTDIRVHLTNTYLSNDILNNITNSDAHDEAKQFQILQFPAFLKILMDQGAVTDPNWLETYLKPKMKHAITHILRMGHQGWLKKSGMFRLTGFDFMLDENMHLWFIEVNARPGINEDPTLQAFTASKIGDMMDVLLALLKGRIYRIQNFVKEFTRDNIIKGNSYDKDELRKQFNKINKDKFEKKFPIREGNTWEPIIDQNLPGEKAYFGIIPDDCL